VSLLMRGASELQENHSGKANPRLRRHWRFHLAVALLAVAEIDARRRRLPVDGSAQPAQILEEELPAGGIAAQPEMFPRNVGQRLQLDIRPIVAPAAPSSGTAAAAGSGAFGS